MRGGPLCKVLRAVLELGEHRLLPEMVLCGRREQERLCSAQLEKGIFHHPEHKLDRSLP